MKHSVKPLFIVALFWLIVLNPIWAGALEITQVHTEPNQFFPEKGQQVSIYFRLSSAAQVSIKFYDGRDLLIRNIESSTLLPKGEHSIIWDGRDQSGQLVPPEAYHYIIQAVDSGGAQVEYDLTELTGGEDLPVSDVSWDPVTSQIRYQLNKPARVNIRIGMQDNGPLLRTLLDWVVRGPGEHYEFWDGKDASGVLDLKQHPKLDFGIDAFALSENTLRVGNKVNQVMLIDDMPWKIEKRINKKRKKKRMHMHSQQSMETRGDFKVQLSLLANQPKNANGLPIVDGIVPVRLDVDPKDKERALARRFEPVFFVDGIFAFENEVGFLPMTWRWDTRQTHPGEHFLTVNFRGYEGNFGMATIKVMVQRNKQ